MRHPMLRSLAVVSAAVAAVFALSGCAAEARGDESARPTAPEASMGAEPTASTPDDGTVQSTEPSAGAPIDVEPEDFEGDLVAGFVFAAGEADCQIQPEQSPGGAAFGCAIGSGQRWTWADTDFAGACAGETPVGCRNGLVVRGEASPEPRRNTDADFGGFHPDGELAPGERIVVGSTSCERDGAGVRCENTDSGHGFTLSASSIDAW